MVTAIHPPTQEQTAHLDFVESMRQIVLEETDGGRRIVRSIVSILEGNAPNCTPWHQLEAAKLLHKLGLGDAQALLGGTHKQGRQGRSEE